MLTGMKPAILAAWLLGAGPLAAAAQGTAGPAAPLSEAAAARFAALAEDLAATAQALADCANGLASWGAAAE